MNILVLSPVSRFPTRTSQWCAKVSRYDLNVNYWRTESAPKEIVSDSDISSLRSALWDAADLADAAQNYNCAIIDCLADPLAEELATSLDMPIIAPGKISFSFSILSEIGSVALVAPDLASLCYTEILALKSQITISQKFHLDLAISDLLTRENEMVSRLVDIIGQIDCGSYLLLGCTEFVGVESILEIRNQLHSKEIRLIDPLLLAMAAALGTRRK